MRIASMYSLSNVGRKGGEAGLLNGCDGFMDLQGDRRSVFGTDGWFGNRQFTVGNTVLLEVKRIESWMTL